MAEVMLTRDTGGVTRTILRRLPYAALVFIAGALLFTNLATAPRPWHDEGSALSVSKTLVEDGVYAVRSSDGYQTFGAIQSVGPTVLLPVALSFKLFGVGLIQGRAVGALFSLATLAVFFLSARSLFGPTAALISTLLLLGSPALRFLYHGRQALGDASALGFLLAGWLIWSGGADDGARCCPGCHGSDDRVPTTICASG